MTFSNLVDITVWNKTIFNINGLTFKVMARCVACLMTDLLRIGTRQRQCSCTTDSMRRRRPRAYNLPLPPLIGTGMFTDADGESHTPSSLFRDDDLEPTDNGLLAVVSSISTKKICRLAISLWWWSIYAKPLPPKPKPKYGSMSARNKGIPKRKSTPKNKCKRKAAPKKKKPRPKKDSASSTESSEGRSCGCKTKAAAAGTAGTQDDELPAKKRKTAKLNWCDESPAGKEDIVGYDVAASTFAKEQPASDVVTDRSSAEEAENLAAMSHRNFRLAAELSKPEEKKCILQHVQLQFCLKF